MIEIKNKYGKVIFAGEFETIKEALEQAIKENANLRNANLRNANLRNANLSDANLSDANLWNANLRNANLSDANLWNANLRNANLSDANLRNANLWNANLRNANLRNANLRNANLRNANLSDANLTILSSPNQKYSIVMKNEYLHIGCQYHTISEWESFTDNEILEMDGKDGLRWWREWKDVVINVAKLYIEQIKELQKKD